MPRKKRTEPPRPSADDVARLRAEVENTNQLAHLTHFLDMYFPLPKTEQDYIRPPHAISRAIRALNQFKQEEAERRGSIDVTADNLAQARKNKARAAIFRLVGTDALRVEDIRGQVIEMLADADFWEMLRAWEAHQETIRRKIHQWAV